MGANERKIIQILSSVSFRRIFPILSEQCGKLKATIIDQQGFTKQTGAAISELPVTNIAQEHALGDIGHISTGTIIPRPSFPVNSTILLSMMS
jgi:hypothetical protein